MNGRLVMSLLMIVLCVVSSTEIYSQPHDSTKSFHGKNVLFDNNNNPVLGANGEKTNYSREESQKTSSFALASNGDSQYKNDASIEHNLESSGAADPLLLELKKRIAVFGRSIGESGINIQDIDNNGKVDIVMGGSTTNFAHNNFWYILEYNAIEDDYTIKWQSRYYQDAISRIALFDTNGDGDLSVFVCQENGTIEVYDGRTMELTGSILTSATTINQILFADANNDSIPEIVFCDDSFLYFYNSVTFEIEQKISYGANDFEIGNVDTDPAHEIVLSSGYVLEVSGDNTVVEWHYQNGFGDFVELSDIDNDGMQEIISAKEWQDITAFDADTNSSKWTISSIRDIDALLVQDIDNDGASEVLYGDGQWGKIHCLDGLTGLNEKWVIDNPDHGVTHIAVYDTDLDGDLEIVWGAGATSTGADHFYVHTINSLAREWQSTHIDGPFHALARADVDSDGVEEIIFASFESNSGRDDGYLFVYDATTMELEWQSPENMFEGRASTGIHAVKVGDVDADGVKEIIVGTDDLYNGAIYVIDGQTHALEHKYSYDSGAPIYTLEIADVDNDNQIEIIAGGGRQHSGAPGVFIYVINGSTGVVEWQSTSLGSDYSKFYSLDVGDIDGDAVPEIIATNGNIFVFDGITHQLWESTNGEEYTALDLSDLDGDSVPEIIAGTRSGSVTVIDGQTYAIEATFAVSSSKIDSLAVYDIEVENQGVKDFVFSSNGLLQVFDVSKSAVIWQSEYSGPNAGDFDALEIVAVSGGATTRVAMGTPYNVTLFSKDRIMASTCFADLDQDGYGSEISITDNGDGFCLTVDGESTLSNDCNDSDANIHPGASEIFGDGVDQDCDGIELCYLDNDGDTYGSSTIIADNGDGVCSFVDGESAIAGDCNDSNVSIHPGASEMIGDGVDQNCDTIEQCYKDFDDDQFRPDAWSVVSSNDPDCQDSGEAMFSDPVGDCNDNDPLVYSGAPEIIGDGVDQDCDNSDSCFQNNDGDAYGSSTIIVDSLSNGCLVADGEAVVSGDCDDSNSAIHPGAVEVLADGVDQNCDTWEICYADLDADGYRSDFSVFSIDLDCEDVTEAVFVDPSGDCNDNDAAIYPGALEICDNKDNNCNLFIDEGEVCTDDDLWLLLLPAILKAAGN